jgi:hypothetical protein
MRFSRQAVWVLLAGAFFCSSVVATRASLRATQNRETVTPRWHTQPLGLVVGTLLPLDDDDDDASAMPRPDHRTLHPAPRASHHPVVASRAPVVVPNRPALPRRKLPQAAGDDVPAH